MTKKTSKKNSSASKTFSDQERAAMQERAQELHTGKANGEKALQEKIAAMPEPDRSMAKKLHEIIMKSAPKLTPKTWYGMPAYAYPDGKIVCFFQNAGKFKARYQILGFSDKARLDDGSMWPASYAITKLTPADEARIAELVKQAVK